ncbi:hypothetical protein CEXT_132731 [Caerostris extrusa]|uniref:Uncharacterized protein n=1 Tax=Caerostris extrusa TaxID=172846 RepID=A0AAV4TRK8_CAEEX|nr:hypothetical protein CEXT_132731 [Caerostris extrusa]
MPVPILDESRRLLFEPILLSLYCSKHAFLWETEIRYLLIPPPPHPHPPPLVLGRCRMLLQSVLSACTKEVHISLPGAMKKIVRKANMHFSFCCCPKKLKRISTKEENASLKVLRKTCLRNA